MVMNMVRSKAESGKPRILKSERKKDITLILLALQEGPSGKGLFPRSLFFGIAKAAINSSIWSYTQKKHHH